MEAAEYREMAKALDDQMDVAGSKEDWASLRIMRHLRAAALHMADWSEKQEHEQPKSGDGK